MGTTATSQQEFLERTWPYQAALRHVARAYSANVADREDLLQDIWLQLWRSYPSFRGEAAYSTFVYRISLNTAIAGRRRASRRPALETGADLDRVAATTSPPSSVETEELFSAIRNLRPIDRALVILSLEERSYAEMADVLGVSVKAVGVRLARAKDRLRHLLSPPGDRNG